MVSTKILLVIAFVMIGAATSTALTCAGVNTDGSKTVSKSSCNAESDSVGKCCYATYTLAGTNVKACTPVTNAQFDTIGDLISATTKANSGWGSYSLDCAQSYITISFLVLAIFAFLF
jgi:hypothetical protein